MQKQTETYLNQSPFDAAMARWERRGNIIAWGVLAAAATHFAPVIIDIILR